MPSHLTPSRRSFVAGWLLTAALVAQALATSAQGPSTSPPAISPTSAASATADIVFYPLPPSAIEIGPDIATVSVEPASTDALEIGVPVDFELGHCGLWSPIDVDGSLWQPSGGVTSDGGPIAEDDDAVIGELINATPGVFVIVDDEAAHWTSVTGTIISFVRAPGALDVPLCM